MISGYLRVFERKGKKVDESKHHSDEGYDIVLFGYNRIGYDLVESFKKIKKSFLIVDYNPETIMKLARKNIQCRYGDAGDMELIGELKLEKAKMIISTIPDFETNRLLIEKVKEKNKRAIIIVISHQIDEAIKLYEEGASYVVLPHFLGGYHTSHLILDYGLDFEKFLKEKTAHLKSLKIRKGEGHEHPRYEHRPDQ